MLHLLILLTAIVHIVSSDIILDTKDNTHDWITDSCIYAKHYDDGGFNSCATTINPSTNSSGLGFWSFCNKAVCSFTYFVNEKFTGMEISGYLHPNENTGTIKTIVRIFGGSAQLYSKEILLQNKWFNYTVDFLGFPNGNDPTQIQIFMFGNYATNKDFMMIDRIKLLSPPLVSTSPTSVETTSLTSDQTDDSDTTTTTPSPPEDISCEFDAISVHPFPPPCNVKITCKNLAYAIFVSECRLIDYGKAKQTNVSSLFATQDVSCEFEEIIVYPFPPPCRVKITCTNLAYSIFVSECRLIDYGKVKHRILSHLLDL